MKFYKLNGKIPEQCSTEEYAFWESITNRRIAEDKFDGIIVSTVFLGLDHQFGSGQPILFETCIFNGDRDGEITRYYTFDEAWAGHKKIVASLQEPIGLRLCPNLPCAGMEYCIHSTPHNIRDDCKKTGGTFNCSGCVPYGDQEYPKTSEKVNDKRTCRRLHLRK
jgi:hypothetical protein